MKRSELVWFQLGFPTDLAEEALLAALSALSGLPDRARLKFDVQADEDGIVHRLAVRSDCAEVLLATLRAAVPSLRLDHIDPPAAAFRSRGIWQLVPRLAVLRVERPAATSASLLASLFPLNEQEVVRLCWTLKPAVRPALGRAPDDERSGHLRAVRSKLDLPGFGAYGELLVSATTPGRARQLFRRTCTVLWSLGSPHGRLIVDPWWFAQAGWLTGQRGRYMSIAEVATVIAWPLDGPDLPGLELGAAKRLVPARNLPSTGRVLGTSNFSGFNRSVAVTTTASTRGLYVLGPTGTGKTSLFKNLIVDDLRAGRGLAVVETNGDLVRDLLDLVPPERVKDVVLLDPMDAEYAVGFNPLAGSDNADLVADQLGELFQRLWQAFWGPRTAQLAHMGLLTLAKRPGSTLLDLPRLFLDTAFRDMVLADLDDPVGLEPDWQWFARLAEREQANVIAPLMNKVRQFTARPSIRAIVGQPRPPLSMQRLMRERKVLLVHLPKGLIGNDTAQLLGCLILTALWQAATERAALPTAQRESFGLYVDEVQDFAAAPVPWDEMFAQGRKYGLALSVAHQNLDQLPRELREVVLANARSKAVFALSTSDAKHLEPLFAPALTAADLRALDAYSVAAIVALDDGNTARPVTLSTPRPPEPAGMADQVVASSRISYAERRITVEQRLRNPVNGHAPAAAPIGRKPRRSP